MHLKAYQTATNTTQWFVLVTRQDFTTLEKYPDGNDFIFRHEGCKVNGRNMAFMLQIYQECI